MLYIYTTTLIFFQWDCDMFICTCHDICSLYVFLLVCFATKGRHSPTSWHFLERVVEAAGQILQGLPWKLTYPLTINDWKMGFPFENGTFFGCMLIFGRQINSSIIAGYELEDLNGNFTLPELYCRALCSSRMDCAAFEAGPFGWVKHPRSLTVRPWKMIKKWWLEDDPGSFLGFGNFSGANCFSTSGGCVLWLFTLSFGTHPLSRVRWWGLFASGSLQRSTCWAMYFS